MTAPLSERLTALAEDAEATAEAAVAAYAASDMAINLEPMHRAEAATLRSAAALARAHEAAADDGLLGRLGDDAVVDEWVASHQEARDALGKMKAETLVRRAADLRAAIARIRALEAERLRLREALDCAQGDMGYAAEEFRKARRMRRMHTMLAAQSEAKSALAPAAEARDA